MSLPVPSPSELAALEKAKAAAEKAAGKKAAQAITYQAVIDETQLIEDFNKSTFDVVNDDIIRRYEGEVRWMNGDDIAAPIVEADLLSFIALDSTERLWNGGLFDPKRIDEFDGTPLANVDSNYEIQKIADQDAVIDDLENGIASVPLDNGTNEAALNSASTTGQVDSDTSGELIDDDVLIINSATDSAILVVENVVETGAGPFTYDFDIKFFIVEPVGTIAVGQDAGIESFSGFTNSERDNQIATDAFFQNVMDALLVILQTALNERKVTLQNQLTEIQANENDHLSATIEATINARIVNIDNFLGISPPSTIDISDVGITALDNESVSRLTEITNRITEVATEISNGADGLAGGDSYYDLRYNTAVARVRLNNGSLSLIKQMTSLQDGLTSGASEAQDLADRYDSLIP